MTVVVPLLYIVAFGLFILGLSGLTGPRTAVRGNKVAAVGSPPPSSPRCSRCATTGSC